MAKSLWRKGGGAAILALAFVASWSAYPDESPIPTGLVRVTYRQETDGKLSESLHVVDLFCAESRPKILFCELTTITINQCMDFGDGKSFAPKAQRSTTEDALRIVNHGADFLALEERDGSATFMYRFEFTSRTSQPTIGALTGFSGAVQKNSETLGKVISWKLVPLVGLVSSIDMACPAMLPGVPTPEQRRFVH